MILSALLSMAFFVGMVILAIYLAGRWGVLPAGSKQ